MTQLRLAKRDIPSTLVDKMESFLGKQRLRFLRLSTVHNGDTAAKTIHSSRELLHDQYTAHPPYDQQIRRFMRKQVECASWTYYEFDDNVSLVMQELQQRNAIPC